MKGWTWALPLLAVAAVVVYLVRHKATEPAANASPDPAGLTPDSTGAGRQADAFEVPMAPSAAWEFAAAGEPLTPKHMSDVERTAQTMRALGDRFGMDIRDREAWAT